MQTGEMVADLGDLRMRWRQLSVGSCAGRWTVESGAA
jgi:hypothetical protein